MIENFQHFILSNRQVAPRKQDKNNLYFERKYLIEPNLPLHYVQYPFLPLVPPDSMNIDQPVTPVGNGDAFINHVVAEADKLPAGHRNVTIYIHGFHHFVNTSFKLDILSGMVKKYCFPEDPAIQRVVGKFIFLSWPATGKRRKLDVRAHEQGFYLYQNNRAMFEKLYAELNKKGIQLNLMAHSFGHRMLNGFLAAMDDQPKKMFDHINLFAADIPHQAMDLLADQGKPGIRLINKKFRDRNGKLSGEDKSVWYNFTKMGSLAGKVTSFFCRYDRMLMASSDGELKRTEEDDNDLVNNYLCMGTVGGLFLQKKPDNVEFIDVLENVNKDIKTFGGMPETEKQVRKQIDNIVTKFRLDVSDHRAFAIMDFSREPWVKLHRYIYHCDAVVDTVGKIWRNEIKPGEATVPVLA